MHASPIHNPAALQKDLMEEHTFLSSVNSSERKALLWSVTVQRHPNRSSFRVNGTVSILFNTLIERVVYGMLCIECALFCTPNSL